MMSLPSELRVLCLKLSSTPATDLPRITPTLLRHVLHCQIPLSNAVGNVAKADASSSSILVHKLKTQLSALLNGKIPEGRFAAVILIKAVVEVGGWEVLRGAEFWVRGLLSVLSKPDPVSTKELAILSLTKIYSMTQPYQTLVREITTPTLPTFITSSLNIIASKSPSSTPHPLTDTVFSAFAKLLPQHTTIFRPFVSQIRSALRQYLAPTESDQFLITRSLKESARRLSVLLLQTAAKNTSGEEWSKAIRELVKDIHLTADQVFRAVVEDWESTAGYIGEPIDVNQALQSPATTGTDLTPWLGIDSGVERLTGLLELLAEYFQYATTAAVTIPLGLFVDVVARMLSIAIPSSEKFNTLESVRLHPAIDRNERDGLWAGMPQIYVAALEFVSIIAKRLEGGSLSMAQGNFDQLVWIFSYGKHKSVFRTAAYKVLAQVMKQIGSSLDKSQTEKLSPIVRACCHDLDNASVLSGRSISVNSAGTSQKTLGATPNADSFLRSAKNAPSDLIFIDPQTSIAAAELLPVFLSEVPQQYFDVSVRSLLERTAILTKNKAAMLASILNPFVGRNGKALATILPHISREFANDSTVEILLRPRMPLLPSTSTQQILNYDDDEKFEDEDTKYRQDASRVQSPGEMPDDLSMDTAINMHHTSPAAAVDPTAQHPEEGLYDLEEHSIGKHNGFLSSNDGTAPTVPSHTFASYSHTTTQVSSSRAAPLDVQMSQDDDSDEESVHLNMEMDTDSDDD